ncbi:hypothetical protein BGZ79_003210 [Entomortierella chlamydospora]|nr:hypothetical protein BGZ79_003210 [Entomortierella chlamydospora]
MATIVKPGTNPETGEQIKLNKVKYGCSVAFALALDIYNLVEVLIHPQGATMNYLKLGIGFLMSFRALLYGRIKFSLESVQHFPLLRVLYLFKLPTEKGVHSSSILYLIAYSSSGIVFSLFSGTGDFGALYILQIVLAVLSFVYTVVTNRKYLRLGFVYFE